jgi:dipeptidyl aminopeptidase/acylaminoacyl peptidase
MSRRDRAIAALLAALAAALVIAAFLGDRAAASWPGRDGSVVYLGVRKGELPYESSYLTTGLRVFDPEVPGSSRVLTVDSSDADPQVSPDGQTIVFSRQVPSGLPFPMPEMVGGLFVVGIDGSGLRQLTGGGPEGESDVDPAFYPSGESIVFDRASGPTGEGDLYSIRLDGSGLRRLTDSLAREQGPTVSPSGRQIAFTCGPADGNERIEDVCSIRPDGSHRRLLTRKLKQGAEPFDPDISPSGRQIAFTLGPGTAADVFTMRADGSRLGALTNRSPSGRRTFPRKLGYASPAYAPGGGSLIALARGGGGPHLVRIGLRGPRHPKPFLGGALASAPVWAPG